MISDPKLKASMQHVAKALTASFPPGTHFVLIVASPDGSGHYISSVDRPSAISLMREMADHYEAQQMGRN